MFFRLTRYRLKTEWLRLLAGLALGVILFSWYGSANVVNERLHSFNSFVKSSGNSSWSEEDRSDPEPGPKEDLEAQYAVLLRESRDYLIGLLVTAVNDWTPPLTAIPLAVLFLSGLFRNKRVGPMLAAGFSRGRVFLSLTGAYFGCILLIWVVSSAYLLDRYRIEYAPEEQVFFRVTLLTWFCAYLWHASIAYLAAMLLRRPLPAFAAALVLWLILGYSTVRTPNVLPSYIIDNNAGNRPLLPETDLWPMLRTDIVAAGFFAASLLGGWLSFRRRDQI